MPGNPNQPPRQDDELESVAEATKGLANAIQEIKDENPDLEPDDNDVRKLKQHKEAQKHAVQLLNAVKLVYREYYLNDRTVAHSEAREALDDVLFNVMGHPEAELWKQRQHNNYGE